jgi:hypothetical protein
MSLQKTKLITLDDTVAERLHNSIGNRSGVIAPLELSSKNPKSSSASEQQVGKVEYTYGWYSAGVGNNDMQDIISKVKL